MKGIPAIIIALCCAFWVGCSETGQDEIKQAVKEDVELSMLPNLKHSGSGLTFSFKSDEIFNCDNAGFQYTVKNTVEDIDIHLIGVRVPEECDGDMAPAVENIEVPSAVGYYTMAIDIGENIHNTGLLEITEDNYRIYLYSRLGMTMPFELMHKIPEGTIWGYVAYPADPQLNVLGIVNDGFQNVTTAAELAEGYYGYFMTNRVYGVILLNTDYDVFFTRHFVYQYTDDPATLQSKVQEIRDQLPAGAEFKVFSWQGENF